MQNKIIYFLLYCLSLFGYVHAQESNLPYKRELEKAEVFLRSGDFQSALTVLDDITTAYPEASDVFYAKGLLYGQMSNYTAAIDNANKAYELNANLQTLNLLLDLYRADNRPDDIVGALQDYRHKHPGLTFISRELISTLAAHNRIDDAMRVYDEEVQANRGSDTLTVLKAELLIRNEKLKEVVDLLSPLEGESRFAPVYSTLGYVYASQDNPKKAIQILDKGLKITKAPILYLDLADAYRQDKKMRQAYEALLSAFNAMEVDFLDKHRVMLGLTQGGNAELTLDQIQQLANTLVLKHPRIAESHIVKGNVLWQRGNLEEARSLFLTAVGINPKQLDAWRMLINADLALQEPASAIQHGTEALTANPGNPTLLYFTGLAYLVQEDYDNSRQMLESALDNSENENDYLKSVIYGTLGDLYHQLEMHAASDIAYEESLSLDSTNITVLNNYAYYLAIRKKDLDKAERYSRISNELEPNSATLQDTYAWVLFQQGKYQEALSWIEKAVKSDQVSAVLLEHYGDILSMVGREKDALKQWERALNLYAGTEDEVQKLETKIKEGKYVE